MSLCLSQCMPSQRIPTRFTTAVVLPLHPVWHTLAVPLQAKNEELARKSAAISEEDLDSVRAEFEARLGVADRKVYALTKERDALRRGADKLNSANDLVKEKDAIIQQAGPAPDAL